MDVQTWLFALFAAIIIIFMVIDLGFLNKKSHKIEFKPALYQSLFWVGISLAFGMLIYVFEDKNLAAEFLSAYVTEKMLSVDNLFVIMLIFRYFQVDEKFHHRILFWGILGAVFTRGIFIGAGSLIVQQFHWVIYFFGALLVYTGIKLLRGGDEEERDFSKSRVIIFAKKYLPFTAKTYEGKFMVKENGRRVFTWMFLILLLVEATDIIFAVDSIPAVFAISQHPFIVFTSNIFAVMGLRSLFFLIENILSRFHYLQKAVSFILVFIGGKMLVDIFGIHLSSMLSFGVIMTTLTLSIILSIAFPKYAKDR